MATDIIPLVKVCNSWSEAAYVCSVWNTELTQQRQQTSTHILAMQNNLHVVQRVIITNMNLCDNNY